MKIRPRNIPTFQHGGGVPQWYIDRYGNRTKLLGWDLNQRYNYANKNLNTNDHRNAGNLDTVYRKNLAYTRTPGAISSDIQTFYNSDGQGMSAEDFVNFYNKNAQAIRNHWATDQTYNARTARDHNRLFKRMFASRSDQGMSPGSDYNIGYQNDLEDIEGSSTWLRRMDQYENEFDPNNPDSNRIHEITLSNGQKARVYKKANGDIALLNSPNQNNPDIPLDGGQLPEVTVTPNNTQVPATHKERYGFDWSKIREVGAKIFGNPDLYALGRLAGNLANNERVYNEQLQGIRPDLRQTYNTHRQVVGDEATKQAYYRRAAAGQTKAARPFTSDADRQMAYQMEARRIGDELRAQGDLADNAEIRRTSDESNQHQWANTQRATEVANANIASINQANALKHNLLAQKHSAQWSSVDNFLKGIEYRKRQQLAEQQSLDDQIFTLQLQQELENDPRIVNGQKALQAVLDKHKITGGYDYENDEVKQAIRNYKALQTQLSIEAYRKRQNYYRNRNLIYFSKSGSKITRKRKDDLLYKSARDVVEHFRKMSKISSDAQDRKKPKIEKLTSHPKGSKRKYQQGGVAPFTVYTPVALGGETSSQISTSSDSRSSKKSEGSDLLDMVKELFKMVAGKGLPSDVTRLYQNMRNFFDKSRAFGTEISTDDIASMYLSQMQELNTIQYLKNNFDKASETMIKNGAENEIAVNARGEIVTQNPNSEKIEYVKSLAEASEKGLTPLTNEQLATLRSLSPDLARRIDLDGVLANGVGMSKIAEFLKSQLPKIESTETNIEGYTKKDSNDIKAGLQLLKDPAAAQALLSGAPEGDYKFSQQIRTQENQAKAALAYLKGILPTNMRAIIKVHSEMGGLSENELIGSLISSNVGGNYELSFDAVTGKAAKDSDGKSKSGSSTIKATFNDMVQRGQIGVPREFSMITKDGQSKLYSLDSKYVSELPNVSSDMSVDQMLSQSEIGQILDSRLGITFGDQVINPENLKDIMFSVGGGATFVTLPCKYENGHKVVNFAIKDDFDDAIKEASKTTPIDWTDIKFKRNLVNILKEKGLDSLLTGNMDLDPNMIGQFLVVEGYSTDRVKFNKNSKYIEKVNNPDKNLENRLNNALSVKGPDGKIQKYGVDINDWGLGFLFEGGWDDIYHGNVFIPLSNDPLLGQIGNDTLKRDDARELAEEYQNYLKLRQAKNTNSNQL